MFAKVAMPTDAVVALSTVAHEIPAAGDVEPDEINQFYKDIDSTYYDDGRPESLKNFEHPRGQAITLAKKTLINNLGRGLPRFPGVSRTVLTAAEIQAYNTNCLTFTSRRLRACSARFRHRPIIATIGVGKLGKLYRVSLSVAK